MQGPYTTKSFRFYLKIGCTYGSILTREIMVKLRKTTLFVFISATVNNHLYSVINFNHVKLRYIEPCNFLTKRAMVSQPSTLVAARDPNISYYLNLSIYFPTSILVIMYYTPSMTARHKWTRFFYYRHQINSLLLVNLLLLINKFSFICEGQSCRIRIILIVAMYLPLMITYQLYLNNVMIPTTISTFKAKIPRRLPCGWLGKRTT